MSPVERATARVQKSPDLKRHRFVLLGYPWPDMAKHHEWVATADERDVIRWAARAPRALLRETLVM